MKFKVEKGTETFKKLIELEKKVKDVTQQQQAVVKQLGGEIFCKQSHKLAGGLSAIKFETKPDGYKVVGEKYQSLYYPKATNKVDCKIISDLPVIEYDELNSIVNFKAPQTVSVDGGIAWISTVGLIFGKNEMLIEVENGCKYIPPKDVIQILESEYEELKIKLLK